MVIRELTDDEAAIVVEALELYEDATRYRAGLANGTERAELTVHARTIARTAKLFRC